MILPAPADLAPFNQQPRRMQALVELGQVLMELSNFQDGEDMVLMTKKALEKFEKAYEIKDDFHEALWHMGNTHLIQAFHSKAQDEQKARTWDLGGWDGGTGQGAILSDRPSFSFPPAPTTRTGLADSEPGVLREGRQAGS